MDILSFAEKSFYPRSQRMKQGTVLSQTLKVQKKEVALLFLFMTQDPRFLQLYPLNLWMMRLKKPQMEKMIISQFPGYISQNQGTLIFLILKVEENAVLFFLFVAQKPISRKYILGRGILRGRKCSYLSFWATNHKTKSTLLLPFLKLGEGMLFLVFELWPGTKIWPLTIENTYFQSGRIKRKCLLGT